MLFKPFILFVYIASLCLLLVGTLSSADGLCRPDDRMNKFGRNNCRKGFCFDYTLVYILAGPLGLAIGQTESVILDHHALVGFTRDDTIAEGRKAVAFFKAQYDIDFDHLTDAQILSGEHLDPGGSGATFAPMVVQTEETLRLYMAATKCGYDFLNIPIHDAAWILQFGNDHPPTSGNVNETVPAESFSVFGSYIIDICGGEYNSHRFCTNILQPKRSRGPLFIRYQSRVFIGPPTAQLSEPFLVVNCDLVSDDLGRGIIRGTLFVDGERDSDQGRSEASNFGGVLGGLIYRLCQSIPTNIPEADPEPPPPAHPQILHGSATE